jgi:hypothetical protein
MKLLQSFALLALAITGISAAPAPDAAPYIPSKIVDGANVYIGGEQVRLNFPSHLAFPHDMRQKLT